MRGLYGFLVGCVLILSACTSDGSESANAGSSNIGNEEEKVEGITYGYNYAWDNTERDLFSLDSQLTEVDYENIETFFKTFSLPEEGRLSLKEAQQYFPDNISESNYSFSNGEIYYKNYLVFDQDTNKALSTNIWGYDPNTYNPIEPFESQAVGLFMTIVDEINDKGYVSPKGELVDEYDNLSDEEKEYLEDESYYETNQETGELPKGWLALQSVSDSIQSKLEYIEPFLKEYQELYTWSKETRQYLQVADSIGSSDYIEAYKYIQAATDNIDRMVDVIPQR